jgi:hypothetical protein
MSCLVLSLNAALAARLVPAHLPQQNQALAAAKQARFMFHHETMKQA